MATWQDVVARQPLPEYLTELGELLVHLGRAEEADAQFAVVRTTIELLEANGVRTDLETALFEADHGSAARAARARPAPSGSNAPASTSPTPSPGPCTAPVATGRHLPIARAATRLGSPEARFWIHRGTIEAALGMTSEARTHLRRGLATDPGLSPWQRDEARTTLSGIGVDR